LKEDESGEFDQEKHPGFKWRYRVVKVAAPDFGALMTMATGGDAEEGESKPKQNKAQNADLFAGPLQMIGKVWGEAIRELHVEVIWNEGKHEKSFETVTHLIASDATTKIQGLISSLTGGAYAAAPGAGAAPPTGTGSATGHPRPQNNPAPGGIR